MFKFQKEKCTEEVSGTIVKRRWSGEAWFLTVEYAVDGTTYRIKEQLTYHIVEKYKIGKIPIGIHSSSAIENIEIGALIRVRYNPDKPKRGYLPDNNGKHLV